MTQLEGRATEVELPSGQLVWVRIGPTEPPSRPGWDEDPDPGPAQDTGGRPFRRDQSDPGSEVPGGEVRRLTGFTEAIGGIAESVWTSLKTMRPDTVEIEFGLDIDVSTGQVVSLIADAHASSSIKVKLGWDKRDGKNDPTKDTPTEPEGDEVEPSE